MDNVAFSFCHLYPMNGFLLFCHNKRSSYELNFIIEEPLVTYLQKKFHTALFFIDASAGRTMSPVYFVIVPANVVIDDGFRELLQFLGTELYLSGLNDRERKEE